MKMTRMVYTVYSVYATMTSVVIFNGNVTVVVSVNVVIVDRCSCCRRQVCIYVYCVRTIKLNRRKLRKYICI